MVIDNCIPLAERVIFLYNNGFDESEIAVSVCEEFSDIYPVEINENDIYRILKKNKVKLMAARESMSLYCRNEIMKQTASMYNKVATVENELVNTFADKLRQVLAELAEINHEELDEEGNFKNTSRVFVLIELAEKLHNKSAKVIGTETMREIEAFKMKAQIKSETDNSSNTLVPAHARDVTKTKFL